MYLLEFHSSLGLVSLIPKALDCILQEFQQICRPNTGSEAIHLEEQILQLSLDGWMTMENPESFYGTQIQRDVCLCSTYKDLDGFLLLKCPNLIK